MMFDFGGLIRLNKVKRLKRIARSFSTRNDGPFRLVGDVIELVAHDCSVLGCVEFKQFNSEFFYMSVVLGVVCFSLDEKYVSEFTEYLNLLAVLDDLWGVTERLVCPICFVSVLVDDDISRLVGHVEREHKAVVVNGFESCGLDVVLKTNIGDFVLEGCKVY